MTLNDKQLETINGITPKGFHLNKGKPCECGGDNYRTKKRRGYSDYITYTHTCNECGNEFSTYIEG
jgi:hypothetical protein